MFKISIIIKYYCDFLFHNLFILLFIFYLIWASMLRPSSWLNNGRTRWECDSYLAQECCFWEREVVDLKCRTFWLGSCEFSRQSISPQETSPAFLRTFQDQVWGYAKFSLCQLSGWNSWRSCFGAWPRNTSLSHWDWKRVHLMIKEELHVPGPGVFSFSLSTL